MSSHYIHILQNKVFWKIRTHTRTHTLYSATVDLFLQSMLLPTSYTWISQKKPTFIAIYSCTAIQTICCDDLGVFCTTSKAAMPQKGLPFDANLMITL